MNKKYRISIMIMGIGLILMIYGILRKEHLTVFIKATKICLECIGIG